MSFRETDEDLFVFRGWTLVNPVNIYGRMGKGLALQFKHRVPGLDGYYRQQCQTGALQIYTLDRFQQNGWDVILFPTKRHWSDASDPQSVYYNLKSLATYWQELGVVRVALPPVGCGLGGLSYQDVVRPMLVELFEDHPLAVVCAFGGTKALHCD